MATEAARRKESTEVTLLTPTGLLMEGTEGLDVQIAL
jgi:hypothetical protein